MQCLSKGSRIYYFLVFFALMCIPMAVSGAPMSEYYNQGLVLANQGNYAESIELFDKEIAANPDHFLAWTAKGVAQNELGQYDAALSSFDRAIQIQPGYYLAWDNRGVALANLGRYSEAVASYEEAIRLEPGHEQAKINRDAALERMGEQPQQQQSPLVYALPGALAVSALIMLGKKRQ